MGKKISAIFFIWALACQWFSIGPAKAVRAETDPAVVINEIAWMGTATSTADEWIELRNRAEEAVDIGGWTLTAADGTPTITASGTIAAGGYYLIERTDDESVPGVAADLIYTGALGNSGEDLELRDRGGNLIDSVLSASGGWPAGDNAGKKTMERQDDGGWQTSESPGGTPKKANSGSGLEPPAPVCGNGIVEAGEECDDGNTDAGDGCGAACAVEQPAEEEEATTTPGAEDNTDNGKPAEAPSSSSFSLTKLGAVVINEFVSDPADGDTEWVELYNTTNRKVDLAGWTVEEGSGAKTALSGYLGAAGADRFYAIAKPKGNLNNAGDVIILRDAGGVLVDRVAYGKWDDGRIEDNAPAAGDPLSAARKIDGYNSYNNANDFIVTAAPTKSQSNMIVNPEAEEGSGAAARADYDYSSDIFISEIFPNPAGSDAEGEFIELYNGGGTDVDLSGWRLGDESSKEYKIRSKNGGENEFGTIIGAGGYFTVYRGQSGIALNNSGDSVKLYRPLEDTPFREVKYSKAIEGWSYNNIDLRFTIYESRNGNYEWSETVTPGAVNVVKTVNHAPVVDFSFPDAVLAGVPATFDSSDTFDEDGDKLDFSWDFGDGVELKLALPEHTFLAPGQYAVKLSVSDGEHEAAKEKIIMVVSPDDSGKDIAVLGWQGEAGGGRVVLNEFMPDPEGSDEAEWIELYNDGEAVVNLRDWRLDDEEGGSRPFTFIDSFWLGAGEYLLVSRAESGIALNNGGDRARLFDSAGELAEEVGYGDTATGMSYARGLDNKWHWTTIPTPGGLNIILGAVSGAAADGNTPKTGGAAAGKSASSYSYYANTTLGEVKNFDVGDLIKAKGTVAVLPGILGSQYFYITTATSGIQVYSYKKDFPKLAVGDLVEVSGEISESGGERRVKTKKAADITVLEHGEAPAPAEVTCAEVDGEAVGRLVTVNGEIVKKSGATIFLDDGTGGARVYFKKTAGIGTAGLEAGEDVIITGLVGRTSSGARILPRSEDDIVKPGGPADEVRVLGASSADDDWTLAARDKKTELFKYLLILAGGAVIVLLGILWRGRKK